MTPDMINGLFEFVGACLIGMSIRRLYYDREVKGVSLFPVTFFASWGVWNLAFYPHLNQWYSFLGGLVMVTMNAIWMLQMAWFIRVAPPKKLTEGYCYDWTPNEQRCPEHREPVERGQ